MGDLRFNAMIRHDNAASMGLSALLGYTHEPTVPVRAKTLPESLIARKPRSPADGALKNRSHKPTVVVSSG